MSEVNILNFEEMLPKIKLLISRSTFISFDIEFFGYPGHGRPNSLSLFDDVDDRYQKLRDWVKRVPPCQIGLSCFRQVDDKFEVDTFTFSLWKRISCSLTLTNEAAMFLNKHKHNFNQNIVQGIPYLNKSEQNKFVKIIKCETSSYDDIISNFSNVIESVRIHLLAQKSKERIKSQAPGVSHPIEKITISLENVAPCLTINKYEAWLIQYDLQTYFPGSFVSFSENYSKITVIFKKTLNTDDNGKNNEFSMLNGFSDVMNLIIEHKIPIVGHNSMLDLLYVYDCFYDDLPDKYDDWKMTLKTIFPIIFDTKILFQAYIMLKENQFVPSSTLRDLVDYLKQDMPALSQKILTNNADDAALLNGSGKEFHDASFDALMTGTTFIGFTLKYLELKTNGKCFKNFQKSLFFIHNEIGNRVPIPLINYQYCYFDGHDPIGHRPDIIKLKLKRKWRLPLIGISSILGKFVIYFIDMLLGPPQISTCDMQSLVNICHQAFGTHRINFKLNNKKTMLMIATNTDSTCSRILDYLSERSDTLKTDHNFQII